MGGVENAYISQIRDLYVISWYVAFSKQDFLIFIMFYLN